MLKRSLPLKYSLTGLCLLILAACGAPDLIPLEEIRKVVFDPGVTIQADIDFCTLDPSTIRTNLKFVFIMDKSGSNAQTDPMGQRRYQSLLTFLDSPSNPQDDSIYYSLVNFTDPGTRVVSDFTNQKTAFRSIIASEQAALADNGGTPYLAALDAAGSLIRGDAELAADNPKAQSATYVVFFLSDGQPTDGSVTDILGRINTLLDLQKALPAQISGIFLHTGYYYNVVNQTAKSLMQSMATAGGGEFFEFPVGQQIDFARFSIPERNIPRNLNQIIVTNANTVWEDGKLLPDLDGDGISDFKEEELGSNPNRKDSDSNGVSDFVEWQISGKPCRERNCRVTSATPYRGCDRFRENPDDSNSPIKDTDGDGLNDCEEVDLLNSLEENFDSNGDWIPDGLAHVRGLSFREGTLNDEKDLDYDSLSNGEEVRLNTPINVPNDSIQGLATYDYNIRLMSSSAAQSCYHVTVSNITARSKKDKIRVYLLESNAIIDNRKFMRWAEKTTEDYAVSFSNKEFGPIYQSVDE